MRVPFTQVVETLWPVPGNKVKAPHEAAVLRRISNERRGRAVALNRQVPNQELAIGCVLGGQDTADFIGARGAQLALELAHASWAE